MINYFVFGIILFVPLIIFLNAKNKKKSRKFNDDIRPFDATIVDEDDL